MGNIKTYFDSGNSIKEAEEKANEFLNKFIADEIISVNLTPFAVPQGFIAYYIIIVYKA